VNMETVIIFLFIQGILFSSLAPYNLPSYIAAEIPLAIIVAFIYRRWVFIGLTWLSSFLSFIVMQTINPIGFIIYFSDLNQKILSIRNTYPSWVVSLAGSLYAISILSNFLFLGKRGVRDPKVMKTIASQSSVIVVLVIVSVLVLAPVVHDVPASMYLSPQVDTFQAGEGTPHIVGGNLVVDYSMPLMLRYGDYQGKYISAFIYYSDSQITVYSNHGQNLTQGPRSYTIFIPYPLAGTILSIFSPEMGNLNVSMEQNGELIHPSNSTVAKNAGYVYSFGFVEALDGYYNLSVGGNISYYSGNGMPSMVLTGYLAKTTATVDGKVVAGEIQSSLISPLIVVDYQGPFSAIPSSLPELYISVNPWNAGIYYPYAAIGAVTFSSIIAFAVIFVRRV